jgi:thioredoxin 1
MIAPLIDEVESEFSGVLKVGKVNAGLNSKLAGRYGIRAIPTLLLFKNGRVVGQKVGAMKKNELLAFVRKAL